MWVHKFFTLENFTPGQLCYPGQSLKGFWFTQRTAEIQKRREMQKFEYIKNENFLAEYRKCSSQFSKGFLLVKYKFTKIALLSF